MFHVVCLLLSRSKKGDPGTAFDSDREGELNHYGTVFSVTRRRSATSTFCTYRIAKLGIVTTLLDFNFSLTFPLPAIIETAVGHIETSKERPQVDVGPVQHGVDPHEWRPVHVCLTETVQMV